VKKVFFSIILIISIMGETFFEEIVSFFKMTGEWADKKL